MPSRTHRAAIGDVFEASTPRGFGYFQLFDRDEDGIELIRMLPGLLSCRPVQTQLAQMVRGTELYFTFYFLADSVKSGRVTFVGNYPIPIQSRSVPTMRQAGFIDQHGKVHGWHIGPMDIPLTPDGYKRLTFVRELTREQRKLSIRQIWGHGLLVHNLIRDWMPQRAEELDALARAETEARTNEAPLESKREYLDHYFFFARKRDAQEVARRLRDKGWFAETSRVDSDENRWVTIAKQPAPINEDIGEIRDELEALAEEFHGKYDGWGAAI